ncbi:hypothetical protein [Streptomyces sp. NRRL B-24484]|uniref:hypothetical protein n=1 Tax=Streptomyces sp. NRRL B-24484 TaxID=1463833 RepID=UPI001F3C2668|nr:hypothetical protein [Streptomyces sp. NRRL B-24484]
MWPTALLGAAVLAGCSTATGTAGGVGPSATVTASKRPLPADAIVPVAGADLCALLGPAFLDRYAPGHTSDASRSAAQVRPEDRVLRTERGGTGPQLSSAGCQVSTENGPGGLGVSFTRALPGPYTSMSPERRCALVAEDRHDRESAETSSSAPGFTFEDMPALGPGGFRQVETRDGRVQLARVQGCHGTDWVMLSIVPGPQSDGSKAANDAVAALQDIYRRLGDV